MTKNEIIYNLCMKIRHDYGYNYPEQYNTLFPLYSYLSPDDKQEIWNKCERIYEDFITNTNNIEELFNNIHTLYEK